MAGFWRADYDGPMSIPSAPRNLGDRVVIQGLKSKPELNGCVAYISGGTTVDSAGVERIQIRAAGGHDIKIKADNLRLETPGEWMATLLAGDNSSPETTLQCCNAWSPAEFAYILRVYSGHVQPQILHRMLLFLITMGVRPELLPKFTCINHSDGTANHLEFLAADGAVGVVRALRANASDEKVAEVGVNVLSMLCVGGVPRLKAVHANATVRDAGGAAAAVLVLKAQPTAVGHVTRDFQDAPRNGVVQCTCRLLSSLVRGDDGDQAPTALTPFQIAVYDAGGLQALLKAMSQNPTSPEVMRDALKALSGLFWAAGKRLTGSVSLDSIVDAALPGMHTCLQTAAVQINGCNALNSSLGEFPISQWSRSSELMAKAAVAAMGTHKKDTDTLTNSCILLHSLASNGFVQAVRDAGAERVVSRVIRTYSSSPPGVGKALYGLAQIVAAAISDEAAGTASITEVVEALAEAKFGIDGGADLGREVPRCAGCRSISAADQDDKLKQCAGCTQVWYCGSACQRAHWKTHKVACRRHQSEAARLAAAD